MITPAQAAYIKAHAYVPEQLPSYVTAISEMEPFLLGDFVAYAGQERLIFVGYPLADPFDADRLAQALDETRMQFKPKVVSVTAPVTPSARTDWAQSSTDSYYRLDLSTLSISQKVRNMLRRADREVAVNRVDSFGREHQKLVKDFLSSHHLDETTQFIFSRIPDYVDTDTAWIFEARNTQDKLVAFDVAEFGPRHYACYMFNFRSRQQYVPGASDLLLSKIIEQAGAEDKRYLNLGLGINPGVTFFKTKWGAVPFLPHIACWRQEPARDSLWQDIFDSLL